MEKDFEKVFTTYDHLLRAWENSMELTRDFQYYAKKTDAPDDIKKVFAEFAEDEAIHASKFRELVHAYKNKKSTD